MITRRKSISISTLNPKQALDLTAETPYPGADVRTHRLPRSVTSTGCLISSNRSSSCQFRQLCAYRRIGSPGPAKSDHQKTSSALPKSEGRSCIPSRVRDIRVGRSASGDAPAYTTHLECAVS
ncbi:hypothetical protein N657DRAFT_311541 [Parathielavia appendiculata]|uniref:Uncharacterized protein n=1 Tax=Parathielavia appendiculata TaxID=2587402 RepID=A0AAN6U7P0_9PEZI|nr:hypothetical protein N657DRAFT_311541 [Parathielavia appendiculata]